MTPESIIRDRAAELGVDSEALDACLAAVRALETGEGDATTRKRTILRLLPGAWERISMSALAGFAARIRRDQSGT